MLWLGVTPGRACNRMPSPPHTRAQVAVLQGLPQVDRDCAEKLRRSQAAEHRPAKPRSAAPTPRSSGSSGGTERSSSSRDAAVTREQLPPPPGGALLRPPPRRVPPPTAAAAVADVTASAGAQPAVVMGGGRWGGVFAFRVTDAKVRGHHATMV